MLIFLWCTALLCISIHEVRAVETLTLREKVRKASIIALANKSIQSSRIERYETVISGGMPVSGRFLCNCIFHH